MRIKLSDCRMSENNIFLKQQKNCIYCIRNIINDKIYIGQTKCLLKRIQSHIVKSKKSSLPLYKSIRKYGSENFEIFVISNYVELNQMDFIETYLINYYKSFNKEIGYNICIVAKSSRGVKRTDETKQKLSTITKKQWKNKEWVQDICQKRTETKNTDKYRKECSDRILRLKECCPNMDRRKKVEMLDKHTLEVLKTYSSLTEASKDNNVTINNIYNCCQGISHTCRGYRWKYVDKKYIIKEDGRKNKTEEHKRKIVKSRKDNGNEGKKVIDIVTGEIFNSIIAAANSININENTLLRYLKGVRKNKTNFKYYIN